MLYANIHFFFTSFAAISLEFIKFTMTVGVSNNFVSFHIASKASSNRGREGGKKIGMVVAAVEEVVAVLTVH